MDKIIVAGTGHRAKDAEAEEVVRTKSRVALGRIGADVFICGMANGLDLWAADEARLLGVEIWAAKPWAGHGPNVEDRELYARIEACASRVVNVNESKEYPGPFAYHDRNHWMVDNATHVMAYLNPEATSGGTYECVKYARGKKPIRNIYLDPPF